MTPLSSTRKSTNKASFNTSTVLNPAIRFTVEDNKEDGSIPFLHTIVKPEADGTLSLTVYRKPTHTDQYLQWDGHHHLSGNLVSSTPSPIGPKQCATSLSCSNKKRTTSGRLPPNANIPNGLWTRWRKGSTSLPVRSKMGLTTKALQLPNLSPRKLKIRVILSYPTHKVFVKASKRICGRCGIQTHFKGGRTIKSLLVSPRTKTLWFNQSGAIYWY